MRTDAILNGILAVLIAEHRIWRAFVRTHPGRGRAYRPAHRDAHRTWSRASRPASGHGVRPLGDRRRVGQDAL